MLTRAQESLRIILEELRESNVEVVKNAALNERNYGDLQGLNKTETGAKYGVAQVEIWRRSFEICPPGGESLEDTYNRTTPYFQKEIAPQLKAGKNVLVVAHGNSLRALMMYLENIGHEEVVNVEILTGVPRLYTMDAELKIMEVKYL
jgi:2,3-bisphosphoglycerate-dependent phosphoglycerate mutase